MAQSVKRLALGFGSGDDPAVWGFEPHISLWADSTELASDSLCPSLSAPPWGAHAHAHMLSLSLSK